MFMRSAWDIFDPDAPPRQKRPLQVDPPATFHFRAGDGTPLRLTRYQGGAKGPVILSHCIGISSLMYATDTLKTNLLEYLYAREFDVWLLDYRFSIELPASRNQATMDDVAIHDYPAAVSKVQDVTGADSVQVVAHGVGSSTFSMALLAGLTGVRAAVCSQVSTHLIVSTVNRIKARLRLTSALAAMGLEHLNAYTDARADWKNRLYDHLLTLYPIPKRERCDNPVCRRITSIYGPLWKHDKLGTRLHHALYEMFGVANVKAMAQSALIARKGHLVNARGDDVYLPHLNRMNLPIAFVHGGENESVLPRSTEVTFELLAKNNGKGLYSRHVIPQYGHVDCIIGEKAVQDVYPAIVSHLEATLSV